MAVAFFSLIDLTKQTLTAASAIKGNRQRTSKGLKSGGLTKAETAKLSAQMPNFKMKKKLTKLMA